MEEAILNPKSAPEVFREDLRPSTREDDGDDYGEPSGEAGGESFGGDQEGFPDVPQPVLRQGTANTGPKGVLADWADAVKEFDQAQKRKKEETYKYMQKISLTAMTSQQQMQLQELEKRIEEEFDPDDEDAEVFAAYQKRRLAELWAERQAKGKKRYGAVKELGDDDYLPTIAGADKETFVVVHIYNEDRKICRTTNEYLDALAQSWPFVLFCKTSCQEAMEVFDDDSLPALVIYKNGEVVKCIMALGRLFAGSPYHPNSIVHLLTEAGVPMSTAIKDRKSKRDFSDEEAEGSSDESDD